ncbi:AraC family transcriptional regulator [Actinocrispum sp. NPDC049592]|uniref:helix-turn-helix transcriptional regulator n=1 Tax=Actinocrispum sp. NPDC049592 TaxID=3154835 RepID=UPI003420CC30
MTASEPIMPPRQAMPGVELAACVPAGRVVAKVPVVAYLRRAKDLMDREYASPLVLDDLARAAGCSRFHFVRSFRTAYGHTPGRYLTLRRIERAKDLLRSVNLTVTEICMLVGFSSLGSFSSRFTEVVGMSPTEYRAKHPAAAPIPGCFLMTWTLPATTEKAPDPSGD